MPNPTRKQLIDPQTPEQSASLLRLAEVVREDLDDFDERNKNLKPREYLSQRRQKVAPLEHMHPDLPYLIVLLGSKAVRNQIHGKTRQIRVEGLNRKKDTPLELVEGYLGSLVLIALGTQRTTSGFINEEYVVATPEDSRTDIIENYADVT